MTHLGPTSQLENLRMPAQAFGDVHADVEVKLTSTCVPR